MATIRIPDDVPSPAQDCETLKNAFRGWGTDEKAIIKVLGQRNASQRRKIRETYREIYDKDLIEELFSELSGDFLKAVILWTYDPAERDARLANEALKVKKKGIKHLKTIVETACTTSPNHLIAVRQAYCSVFESSLEEDIAASLPPPLAKILLGLVSSYRYDKEKVDAEVADTEVAMLHEAIENKRLDHDHVMHILGTRNFYQLRTTFDVYKQKFGNTIDKDIDGCLGDADLKTLLQMAVLCIECPEKHFAKVVRESIEGFGTDEDSLTRAIVTRAEVDMMKVRGEYFNMYNTSMDNEVIGDTSGDYKDFLMTLLGSKI
ncbi:PREDICTED: annexin D3 [Tarenaya hassleriana]|uniref:annexin D3 n=1 Tax=Tarenaya hassleriana TaxID=28532 RepID=UPI00053C1357|nr:PREDICTED: annexin D3 [Tarenaya hassleriana]